MMTASDPSIAPTSSIAAEPENRSHVVAPVKPPAARQHLNQLDILRGLAILGVLLIHCLWVVYRRDQLEWHGLWRTTAGETRSSFYLFYPLQFGWVGVCLFFVLSGFVIHYSLLTSKSPFTVPSFYIRRFWRIYPPYLLAMTSFAVWQWCTGVPHKYLIEQYVMHALAIHNFHHKSMFELDASFWSLAVEIQFYLLYPLILSLRSRLGMRKTLYAILAVSVLSRMGAYAITDWSKPLSYPLWFSTINLWFDWVLGAYLAERFCEGKKVFSHPLRLFSLLVCLLIASSLFRPTSVLTTTIGSLASAIVIEWCVWTSFAPRLPIKFLMSLGLCSYSFYLWHQPLLDVFFDKLGISKLPGEWVQLIALICISAVLMYAFSYVLYVTVEKNSQRFGKWMASAVSGSSAAPKLVLPLQPIKV